MEFKLLHVGGTLFGDPKDLEPTTGTSGGDTGKIERKVTHTDTKSGLEYSFQSE